MSELIVSKPFLRGAKRFRRGEPAPTDLDKPTLHEYLRLGLVAPKKANTPAPGTTKPATQPGGGAAPAPRKREPAAPKEVKTVTNTPPVAVPSAADAAPTALLGDSGGDLLGGGNADSQPGPDAGAAPDSAPVDGET